MLNCTAKRRQQATALPNEPSKFSYVLIYTNAHINITPIAPMIMIPVGRGDVNAKCKTQNEK